MSLALQDDINDNVFSKLLFKYLHLLVAIVKLNLGDLEPFEFMSDQKTEIKSVPVGQDSLKPSGYGLERKMTRRGLLKLLGLGVAAAELGYIEGRAGFLRRVLESFKPKEGLTEEQGQAADLFKTAGEHDFVHGLVAKGGKVGDKVIPVKLRNKPETATGEKEPDRVGGQILGGLELGSTIDKAIVVWGNDPRYPKHREQKSEWYAFPNPKNPSQIVFAHPSGFEPNDKLYQITPKKLGR